MSLNFGYSKKTSNSSARSRNDAGSPASVGERKYSGDKTPAPLTKTDGSPAQKDINQ